MNTCSVSFAKEVLVSGVLRAMDHILHSTANTTIRTMRSLWQLLGQRGTIFENACGRH